MNKLTSSQVERIQSATDDILFGIGVRVDHDGILKSARVGRPAQPIRAERNTGRYSELSIMGPELYNERGGNSGT
jgi:hypothetical protein